MNRDAERFEALRREFQDAYARWDTGLLGLYAITQGERECNRKAIERDSYIFGFVPVDHDDSASALENGYWVGARKRLGSFSYEEPCTEFARLASSAGAMLPLVMRNALPNYSPNVAGIWLATLWHLHESPIDAGPESTDDPPVRLLFDCESPFAVSALAIDLLGLNSDLPRWPSEKLGQDSTASVLSTSTAGCDAVAVNDLHSPTCSSVRIDPNAQRVISTLVRLNAVSPERKVSAKEIAAALRTRNDSRLRACLSSMRANEILNTNGHGYFLLPNGQMLHEASMTKTKS